MLNRYLFVCSYIKYDSCSQVHPEDELFRYFTMRDALNATGRPMIYTICPGQGACNGAPEEPYANQWMPADEGLVRGDYWAAASVANAKMCRGEASPLAFRFGPIKTLCLIFMR